MGVLDGKKIVITGGSRGIGAATGIALAKEGAEVLLTYFQKKDLAISACRTIEAAGGKAHCIGVDATDPDQMRRFSEEAREIMGKVDVLFNNAGDLVQRANIDEITAELYYRVMDLNVLSTLLSTQAIRPMMGKGGVIINMSSQAARDGGGPGASLYAASKGAVLTLTRAWAKEFAPEGIRVFAVAPGVIDTDFHRRHTEPGVLESIVQHSMVGKVGEPDDVARAVVYLAQEGGGFMTGTCIDINGGASFV